MSRFEGEDGVVSGAIRDYTRRHGIPSPEILRLERLGEDGIIEHYRSLGFEVQKATDLPGKVYEPHSHHEVYLYGLKGWSNVQVGDTVQVLYRAVEIHIPEGVVHSALVGEEGAEYLFAYP